MQGHIKLFIFSLHFMLNDLSFIHPPHPGQYSNGVHCGYVAHTKYGFDMNCMDDTGMNLFFSPRGG